MDSSGMQSADYNDAIHYLYALQKHGIKLGLDNTNRLLSLLDNPQRSFKSIHVAGTNGKGSTSAMMASVLRAAGFRVGLFTSPHIVSFTERVRVNNAEIEEGEVVELTREVRDVIAGSQLNPTFFEFVTAMAFLYFRRREVEWAVVETGMGGRLDATNVLAPLVSVITNISYDHREFLGGTLREIASEKAGIIKSKVPVVSAAQEPEAMEVIASAASEKQSNLFVHGRDFSSHLKRVDMQGVTFDYSGRERLNDLFVPLSGSYQIENASLAVKAIEIVMEREPISSDSIRVGLGSTRWQGRLELIRNEGCPYDILIDGAHNPSASQHLADAMKRYFSPSYRKIILILGIMGDKDIKGIMEPLLPIPSEIILTAPDYERAAPPEKLAEYAGGMGVPSRTACSVKEAIDLAFTAAGKSQQKTLVVVTGSFYTIGEAKMYLGQACSSPSLSRLR